MASARRRWVDRFVDRAPRGHWACSRTRFPLSLRFLGSWFCFGRSCWRLGGGRRCSFFRRGRGCGGRFAPGGGLSFHNGEGGKSDYRNEGQKFGSHKIRTAKWRNCCFTLNRCIHVGSSFFCPAKLIVGIAGSGGGEEPSGDRSPPPDSDPFSDAQFGKTCVGFSRQIAGAGIADSR